MYCFWLMMQIFVKQSTWLVHVWCVFSVGLKVGNKNIIGGSLESPWWLLLAFCPKNLGGGGDVWLLFYHSMNAGSVVGIPWGGEDTQTLPYTKEFVWTFCIHRHSWPNHQVESPLSNLFYWRVPLSLALLALCSLPHPLFMWHHESPLKFFRHVYFNTLHTTRTLKIPNTTFQFDYLYHFIGSRH